MSESESFKKRSPNFSVKEKTALLNIIFQYKDIIENKRTDGVTWRQKDEAWSKITAVFNSQTPDNQSRTKDSLRKLYDNIKKNVRKEVAAEKRDVVKTGGGEPGRKLNLDATVELTLGIINEKTVYGLKNPFDSDHLDVIPESRPKQSCTNNKPPTPHVNNIENELPFIDIGESEIEHSYCILEGTSNDNFEKPEAPCSDSQIVFITQDMTYSETQQINGEQMFQPTTPRIKKSKNTDWGNYSVTQLREPRSTELQHKWTKRRRPNIQQLTSNQLTEEYLKLAKIKQELYAAEKESLLRHRERNETIFELEKRKLELDIEIKQVELKKLKHNF